MPESKLSKKLKSDPRFIPYNEKYDYNYIFEYIKKTRDSNENIHLIHNALNSVFFNRYYKDLKLYYDGIIKENNLSKNAFLELVITFANRDFYLIINRTNESLKDKKEFNYDELSNSTFESNISELGSVNAQAGLEAGHDGLNTIMNMTLQSFIDTDNSKYDLEHLDNCARIFGFSNIYVVVKAAYDMSIWENHSLKYDKAKKELKVKVLEEKNQILNRIGEYRLERNIFSSKTLILSSYQKKDKFYELISAQSYKKRKTKRLKSVQIIDSEIIYKLADGIDKEAVLKELMSFSALTTYYSFIKNEILVNFTDINLHDVLLVFTEVQNLFNKAFQIKKVESDTDIKNFDLYKIRIKKNDLINYVFSKTKYSQAQIKDLIELFSHKEGYHNIWEKPLIEFDNYLIPIMLPLLSPNTLRMTDFWLEKGGFDLDTRGVLFENYLKEFLLDTLNRKGFFVNIPDKNIFRNTKDDFEEIDLIVELKNITIIAEVKCIKYPFDPRDYHNMLSRLSDGAKQINRKIDFIQKNIEDFKDERYLYKPIIKLVITNLPLFSGYLIDEVAITDFSLIENYFISGTLNKGKMMINSRGLEIDDSYISGIKYYRNEDEFSENLESFFKNPIPISEKFKDVYIEETQLTIPDFEPKIIMDYVQFKQSHNI
jgi:hypothetical protein